MLTRFELQVVLRNQVEDRGVVRLAQGHEAVMEELAAAVGADVDTWALAGLGANIDVDFTRDNPERRGAVAEEILLTEGASEEVAAAVRQRHEALPERMTPLAAALVAAEWLVAAVVGLAAGRGLDAATPAAVARLLDDDGARRAAACLDRLGLSPERAAALGLAGVRRAREDLRL